MIDKLTVARFAGALCVLGVGASLVGCGFGPGDYRVYDVALGAQTKSAGCFFPNNGPDPNTKYDSTDGIGVQQWVLTAGPNDDVYLDTALGALRGASSDSGFHFSVNTVDVNFAGDVETGTKTTDTTQIDLDMTIDGKAISGSYTSVNSTACAGAGCPNPAIPSCTTSADFSGAEVNDVKLEHDPVK